MFLSFSWIPELTTVLPLLSTVNIDVIILEFQMPIFEVAFFEKYYKHSFEMFPKEVFINLNTLTSLEVSNNKFIAGPGNSFYDSFILTEFPFWLDFLSKRERLNIDAWFNETLLYFNLNWNFDFNFMFLKEKFQPTISQLEFTPEIIIGTALAGEPIIPFFGASFVNAEYSAYHQLHSNSLWNGFIGNSWNDFYLEYFKEFFISLDFINKKDLIGYLFDDGTNMQSDCVACNPFGFEDNSITGVYQYGWFLGKFQRLDNNVLTPIIDIYQTQTYQNLLNIVRL